ncbi:MAG: hypothetical protein ACYTFA_16635 [Planctomycetota bacterium]|jgi:hypothetical protein
MLANFPITVTQSGVLSRDVHVPATFRHELLEFIANELPRWRDRDERESATTETVLTSHLCAHLNSAARLSAGWDLLQFRVEETDEQEKGRKIDLVPAPCGATVWIEGRRHADFDTLMPIECKRLPTPKGNKRDEREYVFNEHASTGGIQRFKEGHHGAAHSLAAMIGYIQENTAKHWHECVTRWIDELSDRAEPGWTAQDHLQIVGDDQGLGLAVFRSNHERASTLPAIELRHLWLQMN